MKKSVKTNSLLIIFLIIGNGFINNYNYYFILIYICLFIYHIWISYLYLKVYWKKKIKIIKYIIISIILYPSTYFFICDPNPINCLLTYYVFFPNFIKAIIIILIHTYFLSEFIKNYNIKIDKDFENLPIKNEKNMDEIKFKNSDNNFYFLSDFINYIKTNKRIFSIFLLVIFLLLLLEVFLFLKRIKLWVHFNNKEKTLPISSSKNTTFYITAMVTNIENIIVNYIEQIKKLINYLGKKNVIISIVENGDSTDKTRIYLKEFQKYLIENKILNKFILNHEIDDPRKKTLPFRRNSNLRIKFYSELRNKCFDFLYELSDIDFDNTKIIYFNDIYFEYEDIVNLLSTNNEDYDAVCGLDFYDSFYDRWVSNDLDGNSFRSHFPYFINKEAQDLVINHKPIRIFSCWNGVIAFKASPLKDKKIRFRYKINETKPIHIINNSARTSYESECTYFHIDLFSLGYTKKFINPDVRVTYEYKYYLKRKYFYPAFNEIKSYFALYIQSFKVKRNKFMSNYKDKEIKLNTMLENWYLENKQKD